MNLTEKRCSLLSDLVTYTKGLSTMESVLLNNNGRYAATHPTTQTLAIDQLNVDSSYQRKSLTSPKKMARNWDPRAAGQIVVGRRPDGSYWIIDGQQRRTAMRILQITTWDCLVIPTNGPEDEAKIFALLNGGRTNLTGRDLFKSRLVSGDLTAHAIVEICQKAGFTVSTAHNQTATNIAALNTLYSVGLQERGLEIIERSLRLISRCWPNDPLTTQALFLRGMFTFIGQHGDKVEDERAFRMFRNHTATRITQDARKSIGRDISANIMRTLARLYNSRLQPKNRLVFSEE